MATTSLKIAEILRRIGFKEGQGVFDILPIVQPVIQVASVQGLGPFLDKPAGIAGGRIAGVAANRSRVEIESRAPGGSHFRFIVTRLSAGVDLAVSTFVASSALATTHPFRQTGRGNTLGRCTSGTGAALLSATLDPRITTGTELTFFLPPGRFVLFETTADNEDIEFAVEADDVIEILPDQ